MSAEANAAIAVESKHNQISPEVLQDMDFPGMSPVSSLGGGLSYKTRGNRTENLTVERAYKYAELPEFSADRKLSNPHVLRLMTAMREGRFHWERADVTVCTLNGKEYRMNGNHTCWARIELGTADPAFSKKYICPVTVHRYEAETEDDMRRLYANIDRNKPRSKSNVIHSYLFDSEQFAGYSKPIISALSQGLSGFAWGFDSKECYKRHSTDEIAYLLKTEYYDLAIRVANCLKLYPSSSHIKRGPVYAAMFATYNKHQADSDAFWEGVVTGANLTVTDPRLKLRNALSSHSINAGRGGGRIHNTTVSGEEMYRWCIYAWNAYRSKQDMKLLRAQLNAPRPVAK